MSYRIITGENCRYCRLAKQALDLREIEYEEVPITPEIRAEMKLAGLTTVPQIYENGVHIGGHDDLMRHLTS